MIKKTKLKGNTKGLTSLFIPELKMHVFYKEEKGVTPATIKKKYLERDKDRLNSLPNRFTKN